MAVYTLTEESISYINANILSDYVSFVSVMNQCDVFLSHLITLTIKKNYNQIN